jgi:SNF family Na+-dependent transporter
MNRTYVAVTVLHSTLSIVAIYLLIAVGWFFSGNDVNRWIAKGEVTLHDWPTVFTLLTIFVCVAMIIRTFFHNDRS